MRVWMNPASRSPCADWFRFMKSMSIEPHGRSRLNCVWRCTNGFCSAFSPRIHIFDGENVCIQRMRPAQFASEFASMQSRAISSGVVSSDLKTVFSGSFGDSASAAAISRASAATRCSGPGPYRCCEPQTNQISGEARLIMVARVPVSGGRAPSALDLDRVIHEPAGVGGIGHAATAVCVDRLVGAPHTPYVIVPGSVASNKGFSAAPRKCKRQSFLRRISACQWRRLIG